jgi:hypothetical protein
MKQKLACDCVLLLCVSVFLCLLYSNSVVSPKPVKIVPMQSQDVPCLPPSVEIPDKPSWEGHTQDLDAKHSSYLPGSSRQVLLETQLQIKRHHC